MTFTDTTFMFGVLFTLAVVLSAIVTYCMVRVSIHDEPDHRSSHSKPTPTSGGVGLLAALGGVALGINLMPATFPVPASQSGLLCLAFFVAFIGLYDDAREADAKMKFLLLTIVSLFTAFLMEPVTYIPLHLPFGPDGITLPYAVGLLGTALWIFVVMNAVNFLDGANGLMATHMLVASSVLSGLAFMLGAPIAGLWAGALAAGLIGFLFFNFRSKALIFCGDVGALLAGYVFAVAGLYITKTSAVLDGIVAPNALPAADYLFIAPILILPLMADVLLTQLYRVRRGQSLLIPHRDHLFQRALIAGWSHKRVAVTYGLWAASVAALVVLGVFYGFIASVLMLAGLSVLLSFTYAVMQRKFRYTYQTT